MKIHCGVEQLGARRAHNPKVTGSSPVPATSEDSSVKIIGESFFVPLYPLLNLGLSEKLPEYLRFDIHDFLGISLFH
jgi:hypothetical protein